jgi:3-carboxy-cis,cis-muconate cycloisomerase
VKPSSSTSEPPAARGLFDGVLSRGPVAERVDDPAWLRAMLDVEAALARAEARAGVIAASDADAIARACDTVEFDVAAIGRDAAGIGNPVGPLVRALTDAVEGSAAGQVHLGATSQDVLDTAAMLVARRALEPLLADVAGASNAAAALARAHRDTPAAGRTLLQQAVPIAFGLKAAGWMSGLDAAAASVRRANERLAVQFGGAAGTLAALGDAGLAVLGHLAEELGLEEPALPWHTERTRVGELAGALGVAASAIAKPARDVTLLAQTEVAEAREGASGGSSTLPHKRNPVAAVAALGCAMQAPGLTSTLLASMVQEHERAAGAWHAEWRPLTELLLTVGSAASWLRECLEHLELDEDRIRANLDLSGGAIMTERVAMALTPSVGRLAAHDLIERAALDAATSGRPLVDALSELPDVAAVLDRAALEQLFDPAGYLGSAGAFVDRALRAHESGGPA